METSLGAKKVSECAVQLAKGNKITCSLVSDLDTLTACERFLSDHKILVEPACGAALSPVYNKMQDLRNFNKILVIVCGGSTTSIDDIRNGITALTN